MATLGSTASVRSDTMLPSRPSMGASGRQVLVTANHFPIAKFFDGIVTQYDVDIQPKCPRAVQRTVFNHFVDQTPATKGMAVAYDGEKIAYSTKPVETSAEGLTAEVSLAEGRKPFTVTLRQSATVNMQELVEFMRRPASQMLPTAQIQIMDIVLKQGAAKNLVAVGSSRFFPRESKDRGLLGGGLECWSGFFGSVIPTLSGLSMNIDLTTAAFWQQASTVAVIGELLNCNPQSIDPSRLNFQARRRLMALKNVKVTVNHRNVKKKFTISRFSEESARNTTFEYNDQATGQTQQTNVAAYFQKRYNRALRFPNLPCVVIQKPGRDVMYLPAEVCEIVGEQPFNRKLLPDQTAEMIKVACKKPHERQKYIFDGANHTLTLGGNDPFLRGWDAQVNTNRMLEVKARVLPPPTLHYGNRKSMQPRDGQWNMRDLELLKPCAIDSWAIIVCSDRRDYDNVVGGRGRGGFAEAMMSEAGKLGIRLPRESPPVLEAPNMKQPKNVMQTLLKCRSEALRVYNKDPQIIMVVYKDDDKGMLYNMTKNVAETTIGVATQFVNAKKVFNAKPQYCANVWLKMNAKLEGSNCCVSADNLKLLVEKPTIVLGADVSHPGPDDPTFPSICAVTGSIDAPATRFSAQITYQNTRLEIIQELKESVKTLLKQYLATTRQKPQRIIMFRDGVSESQFAAVQREEITAIRAACTDLDPSYKPSLTFLCVLKRHHTRFFADRQIADRSGNAPAGLVVDQDVASPHLYDFFLQSHSGLQGTCRSMHYYVLHDENHLAPDVIQAFCNNLAYSFARCTRSVKLVPAVYYSHLAAERARKWISGGYDLGNPQYPNISSGVSSTSRASAGSGSNRGDVDYSWCPKPAGPIATKMWFI